MTLAFNCHRVLLGADGVKHKPTYSNSKKNACQTPKSTPPEEGLVVLDSSLRVMSFNHTAQEILGSMLKHGRKLVLNDFIVQGNLPAIYNVIKKTLHQGDSQVDLKVEVETPFGKNFSILYSTYPLYENRETILGVILSFRRLGVSLLSEEISSDISSEISETVTDLGSSAFMQQRSFLEALPEGVFTINTKWRIAFFNRTAEKITGYNRKEVLGRYCWEVFRSDLCELGCPLRAALETGQVEMDQDIRILKKQGVRQTILVNIGVLRDEQGLILGAVETFRPLAGEITPIKGIPNTHTFSNIIGSSKPIKQLFSILPDIAASEANVFITGESGTGKELFARTIHDNSSRAKHPFVAINCAALAESILESELFGHEKEAFTGATKTKFGRFELVKKGTLFLDEIGELKPSLQIKLLRVLEQREFERVGGTTSIPLEARIISATNKDLSLALENGSFREDFYYRLRTVPIVIPPLRDRKEDIPLLVDYFIGMFNAVFKKKIKGVDHRVMEQLSNYDWPGNVRELERTIEHAFVFVKGSIILPGNLPQLEVFNKRSVPEALFVNKTRLDKATIVQALRKAEGKKKKAADSLGISRTSLWRKMKSFHLLD